MSLKIEGRVGNFQEGQDKKDGSGKFWATLWIGALPVQVPHPLAQLVSGLPVNTPVKVEVRDSWDKQGKRPKFVLEGVDLSSSGAMPA